MEISNLSDAEFKTLVIRMFKELSEDLSSIKKIQSETKDSLIEIKTIYRETTVEWIKPRIKSMIWTVRKQKTTNPNYKKKRESKKSKHSVSKPLVKLQQVQHSHQTGARKRKERARNGKSLSKNNRSELP